MNWKKPQWLISSLILIAFTLAFILEGNYEFLAYAFVLGAIILVLALTDKIFNYTNFAKWGFSLWLLLHLAGGALIINGTRLYDTILIDIVSDYNILRYDQLIHAFCYFVITLLVYSIVIFVMKPKANKLIVMFLAFAAAMGISALNEIVELFTVVFLNSSGVGDYLNNAFDLVFNALGSLIALFFVRSSKTIK